MPRRKTGNPVHGWLVLDKPVGMTSTEAVTTIRRLYNAQKAGHAGTLDPLATGILPIALGEATKTVAAVVEGEKAYRFSVRWGAETRTDDAEGEPVKTSGARPAIAEIEALLPRFTGKILQIPPRFSAIKVDGERAYDLARDGGAVVLEPRPVVVAELKIIAQPDANTTAFEVSCGKGTYVRALARDLGRALGCYGHVVELRRTRVGPFDADQALTLDALSPHADAQHYLPPRLLPVEAALEDILKLNVSMADAACLKRGQAILLRGRDAPILTGPAYAVSRGQLIAIGEIDKGELRPRRVFNLG
ncbi:MAG TPA: tRNA pseudouridine(55) synthase TruB [Hyphomicrobiaceae bacterium]|jgi:tRNA pseudouridine55 synthase|nr:tRNA pseudouridine(55) synthase TruB [Hyphomicrobiaceae bacterium]